MLAPGGVFLRVSLLEASGEADAQYDPDGDVDGFGSHEGGSNGEGDDEESHGAP